MTTVLITGGAGFIGSAVSRRLVARGDDVVALDAFHPQVHPSSGPIDLPSEVRVLPGDVTHAPTWDAALRLVTPHAIVHLAAETGTGQSLTEATRHGSVNVVGTTALIDALTRRGVVPLKVVLASSRAVYGEGLWADDAGVPRQGSPRRVEQLERGRWEPEWEGKQLVAPIPHRGGTTPAAPTSVYGATKLAQEHILSAWSAATGVDLQVLRLQNVYGPGQSLTNSYTGILALFHRLARNHEVIPVYEDGRIVRDFVFIDDVAAAIVAALDGDSRRSNPIDIGGGVPSTLLEVAQRIAELWGAPPPEINGWYRAGDVRAASANIDAATATLGWHPTTSLAEGQERLARWVGSTAPD